MLQGATNTDFNSIAVSSEVKKKIYKHKRESNANADTLQSRSEIDIIRLPAYNSTYSHNSSKQACTNRTQWKKVASARMLNAAKVQRVQLP